MIDDLYHGSRQTAHIKRSPFEESTGPTANIQHVVTILSLLIALFSVVILSVDNKWLPIYVIGVAAVITLVYGVRYALKHPSWFPFALIVEESAPYFNFIPVDPSSRWFLRYPLLIPLALPAVWSAVKSRVLFTGRYGLMVIFFVWGAVTCSYSLSPITSAGRLIPDFILFATLCFTASRVNTAEDVQEVLGRFVLGCGILQIMTAAALLFFPEVLGGSGETLRQTWFTDERGLARFCGVFNEPNAVGSLMLATVGSGIAHWSAVKKRWRKVLLALSMVASIIFAILADSRSETFAAAVGCFSFGIWRFRWKGIAVVGLAAVLAVGCFGIFRASMAPYLDRGLETMTGRSDAWSFEVLKAEERPWLGYGYQSEGEILLDPRFTDWQQIWDRGAGTPLHNGYMTLVIGTGIPATIFWLFVFLGPWWSLIRGRRDPWNLIPLVFLVVLPTLLLSIDESGLSEPRYVRGLLLYTTWAIAERYQLIRRTEGKSAASTSSSRWPALLASIR